MHIICIVEIKNVQKILVGSHEWRRQFGIPCKGVTLNHQSEGRVQWYSVVSSYASLVSTQVGEFCD